MAAPQPTKKMYSDNDELCLEDESGRIKLVGPIISNTQVVTGGLLLSSINFAHVALRYHHWCLGN